MLLIQWSNGRFLPFDRSFHSLRVKATTSVRSVFDDGQVLGRI